MALINVKKKIEKASDKLGIGPDETILAACTTNPAGTMKRMMARELGGAIASAAAGSTAAIATGGGLAETFPNGQMFVAVTSRRVLVAKMNALTGKPKELTAQYPREQVTDIIVDKGRLAAPFTIVFADGTAVQIEGAKGTDPGSVADALAA
ncbi:MAG: hypothetical protein ACR2P0_16805 [Acidimicrobiales bacterium]